jgi:hypothetical protein
VAIVTMSIPFSPAKSLQRGMTAYAIWVVPTFSS